MSNPTNEKSNPTFITLPVPEQSEAEKRAEGRVNKPYKVNIHDN